MTLTEKSGNLFSAPPEFYFAHCISGDYALGAGIAKTFDQRFNMKQKLNAMYPIPKRFDTQSAIRASMRGRPLNQINCYKPATYHNYFGRALLIDKTFNLVTKDQYWEKPTYHSLRLALVDMVRQCRARHITKLAMPRLGCGLDRLSWDSVRQMIETVFEFTDIEIVVYSL